MTTDPIDGKLGLRIESAASVILRDTIKKHMQTFSHVVRSDRAASASVVAAYIDGGAGADDRRRTREPRHCNRADVV
jgi:hypothetical protein